MRALLVAALPALATAQHYPGDPISVASYGGNWTIAKSGVTLATADGAAHFNERGMVRVTVSGVVNKKIQDGNVQWTFSEQGVPGKETSGSFGYFKCNKQNTPPCNPATPMYLTIDKPLDMVGSPFTFSAPLQLPYKQKTGQMTLSLIATDEDHAAPADFTLGISFNYTQTESNGEVTIGSISRVQSGGKTECKSNADCPSSYCKRGFFPPHHCHDCGANCCNSDDDCPGSYCMNDPSKTAPFSCHANTGDATEAAKDQKKKTTVKVQATLMLDAAKRLAGNNNNVQGGGKTECKQDVDCPSSYCMNGDGKSQPYHCHDCGENCCNSDADCPGSYCMDSPGKVAPYTCH
jgi:hypothetical protein